MIKKFHKFFFILAISCLMVGKASATDLLVQGEDRTWNYTDTLWETAYLFSHVADWGQTRDIASQCDAGSYVEMNPILGACPSMQRVNTYFLSTALLHAGISTLLPRKYRRFFQTSTMIMEIGYVTNNYNIGLKFNF